MPPAAIRPTVPVAADGQGSALAVFLVFFRLGCTSFGGPVAHLGYFRAEFVERRRWLSAQAYAELVALSQFLPGPASSQTGFGIGLCRAGLRGGAAAWAGFTLPSAVLLVLFAYEAPRLSAQGPGRAVLHGLMLVAVAVVAQAVLGMARQFCVDRARATIATAALVAMLLAGQSIMAVAVIVAGGVAGWLLCRKDDAAPDESLATPVSRRLGSTCLLLYGALLAATLLPVESGMVALFDAFYRAGALVFGGGHVVLPLLRDAVVAPGWVTDRAFLAGYGAAQAMPGPLFTFAAYLGAASVLTPWHLVSAVVATVAIFLPGLLCLLGVLPFWHRLRHAAGAQAAMRGTNAAVVGLLAAALYNPVWTGAVGSARDAAVVAVAFAMLVVWRASPLLVVVVGAVAAAGLAAAS